MTVETILYLSSEWELNDIKTVIEKHLGYDVKVESCHKTSIGFFHFFLSKKEKQSRMMSVFMNSKTPIGSCTQLRLGCDKEAIAIMTKIADVFGGILEEDDCKGKLDMIEGALRDSDGIPYFYKYALIQNKFGDDKYGKPDNKDLKGLNRTISEWGKQFHCKTDVDTYPVEEGDN